MNTYYYNCKTIFILSFTLLFLFSSGCKKEEQDKAISQGVTDCAIKSYISLSPNYIRYDEPRSIYHLNYCRLDLYKSTSLPVTYNYPSIELQNLDSITSILHKLSKEKTNSNQSLFLQIKLEKFYFMDFCKILCIMQNDNQETWVADFRYNEFLVFVNFNFEKINQKDFLKTYKEDIEALEKVKNIRGGRYLFSHADEPKSVNSLKAFSFGNQTTMFNFRKQFAEFEYYHYSRGSMNTIDSLMIAVNKKYTLNKSDDEQYNYLHRQGLWITLDPQLTVQDVFEIYPYGLKHKMIPNLNHESNTLIFYTTCSLDDEILDYYP
jgi:hypothetical protein